MSKNTCETPPILTIGQKIVENRDISEPDYSNSLCVIKQKFAELIDAVNDIKDDNERGMTSESLRLFSIALTHLETADMFVAKAISRK